MPSTFEIPQKQLNEAAHAQHLRSVRARVVSGVGGNDTTWPSCGREGVIECTQREFGHAGVAEEARQV